jgi:hypothetical protein
MPFIDLPLFENLDTSDVPVVGDPLSTLDTSSEMVVTPGGNIGGNKFGEGPGSDTSGNGVIVNLPDGFDVSAITRATYVMLAYREAQDADFDPEFSGYTGYFPQPGAGDMPFISLDSPGTSGFYSVLDLPVGAYGEDVIEWTGSETLSRLTSVGSQAPSNRIWNERTNFPPQSDIHIAYYAIRLYYGVDTPCDTTVDLDLSTATFENPSGDQFGQYVDGVITGLDGEFPQYTFPITLDPLKKYRVTVIFDPTSSWDGDGNPATSDRFVLLRTLLPGDEMSGGDSVQIGDGFGNTADTCALTIGPGIGNWDDADFGVTQGYTDLLFQTSASGAVSAISIRKLCTYDDPPLRLTNRADTFGSALSLTRGGNTRQGSNRLTAPL